MKVLAKLHNKRINGMIIFMKGIDLTILANEIRTMTRRQKLYRVIKTELKKRRLWKDKPRGAPAKGYAKTHTSS